MTPSMSAWSPTGASPGGALGGRQPYGVPIAPDMATLRREIAQLPERDPPELLGLHHAAAEDAASARVASSQTTAAALVAAQALVSAGAGGKSSAATAERASDLSQPTWLATVLSLLPAPSLRLDDAIAQSRRLEVRTG